MLDPMVVLTIVLMASVTYLTRLAGYLFLRDRVLSPRMKTVMETAPGCVLITVIAPDFVTGQPADMLGLAITVVAASTLPMLPTVLIAVASTGLLRTILG
jgi:uncharacterized membrane protein